MRVELYYSPARQSSVLDFAILSDKELIMATAKNINDDSPFVVNIPELRRLQDIVKRERKHTTVYSLRIDSAYDEVVDYLRIVYKGGLSEFVSRQLAQVKMDATILEAVRKAKAEVDDIKPAV